MKIILSPAKTLNLKANQSQQIINPIYLEESLHLYALCQKISKNTLQKHMHLSDKLTQEVYDLYHQFNPSQVRYPAIELYNGLAFRQIHVLAYNQDQLNYLDSHLSILSAMYGVLSAYTSIWPYRLDFTMNFKQMNLKKYWKAKLNNYFKQEDWILNLASEEFSDLIDHPSIHTIHFFDEKAGVLKINAAEAKKARGQTLEWCVLHSLENIEELASLQIKGYRLVSHNANQTTLVRKV